MTDPIPPAPNVAQLIVRLRKMSVCVYLAAEEGPADDLADGLRKAADALSASEARVASLEAELQGLQKIGTCRNGAPHYCPNCDNTFSALTVTPEAQVEALRQENARLRTDKDAASESREAVSQHWHSIAAEISIPSNGIDETVTERARRMRIRMEQAEQSVRTLTEALELAQLWLCNCVPVIELEGLKPLPVITAALAASSPQTGTGEGS